MSAKSSDEAMKSIFLTGLEQGRKDLATWTEPLPAGHVRLAVRAGDPNGPLDVRPCYRAGRMIVDLRTVVTLRSAKDPARYVVSDSASGMRLCAFDVTSRGKAQGEAKRKACRAADDAAKHIEAAEFGDLDAIRILHSIRKAAKVDS